MHFRAPSIIWNIVGNNIAGGLAMACRGLSFSHVYLFDEERGILVNFTGKLLCNKSYL